MYFDKISKADRRKTPTYKLKYKIRKQKLSRKVKNLLVKNFDGPILREKLEIKLDERQQSLKLKITPIEELDVKTIPNLNSIKISVAPYGKS